MITAINTIKANAIASTVKHSTAESACPYPLDSEQGKLFVTTFNQERQRQEDAITAAAATDIRHGLSQLTGSISAPLTTIAVSGWAK
jgi:hypothetical protein